MQKDYLTGLEFSPAQTEGLLDLALLAKQQPEKFQHALSGKSIVMLFEKPSLRTRMSFEVGIQRLGGQAIYLDHKDERIGVRESIADYARNFSVWVHGIIARVFAHQTLTELAKNARVPVVNALCEKLHPCQALADYLSLKETYGNLKGLKLAYVGDGNNVSHSLLLVGAMLGVNVTVLTPQKYACKAEWLDKAQTLAAQTGATVRLIHQPNQLGQQDVLYTDTWVSMGESKSASELERVLKPYQLNETMVAETGAGHVMHCQPAHRDVEITSALFDSNICLAMRQAENRLHAQNALLLNLFNAA
ncbi:ornithine carbamoyltransferase [Permianibacter aggregans]|uniref:Ornithine carbamoyltransferase n=1 Tax=Permianibacter aggregans TaxID=1510150 RepID=A0A4R6UEA2_9GAMM|nr:ornithine carbamoyltransferase [Permianibacter aggregans]QGX38492.1 ornithine carbamoyltransferase [Permianibacter aggregans]TDQ45051.1 ornithine carbamoyltransferase [Permianibacter aggregans]